MHGRWGTGIIKLVWEAPYAVNRSPKAEFILPNEWIRKSFHLTRRSCTDWFQHFMENVRAGISVYWRTNNNSGFLFSVVSELNKLFNPMYLARNLDNLWNVTSLSDFTSHANRIAVATIMSTILTSTFLIL